MCYNLALWPVLRIHTHTHTHTQRQSSQSLDFGPDIPIIAKLYTFYSLFSQHHSSFPKSKRYSLGEKIDTISLEIIELIIAAGYTKTEYKETLLKKISYKLDLLKLLLRLSWETKCLKHNAYQTLSSHIVEVGKMLGGWIKKAAQL